MGGKRPGRPRYLRGRSWRGACTQASRLVVELYMRKKSTPKAVSRHSLFGPPPVLDGEDAAVYYEILDRVRAAVGPVDIIDEMLIDDAVYSEWDFLRWRRLKSSLIRGLGLRELGRVDGFDQDEAESKRDERAVMLRRLLASKCDTLKALELANRLFDACPRLVECFRKEGGYVFGVGSIRDSRAYSALACGFAI